MMSFIYSFTYLFTYSQKYSRYSSPNFVLELFFARVIDRGREYSAQPYSRCSLVH